MKKRVLIFCFVSILFLGCGSESKSFNQYDRDGEQNVGDQEQFEGDFDDLSDSDSVEESPNHDSDSGSDSAYNCATIHRCVKHCGSDAACRAKCVEGGSVDGAKKYKNLTSCIDDNCMFLSEEETAECVNKDCAGELKSCGLEEAEIGDFEPSASGGESGSGGDSGGDSGSDDDGDSGGIVDGSKCGNGKVGSSEFCDDGKNNGKYRAAFPGYCNSDCGGYGEGGFCGDNALNSDEGEVCDDGFNNGKYGFCKKDCSGMGEYCGDGEKNGGEFCDEGEENGKIGRCNSDCLGVCGDGIKSGGEFCDDGEENGTYGHCPIGCVGYGPRCGDGVKNGPEFCDEGENNGQTGRCDAECLKFVFPYLDSSSGLMWSAESSSRMNWKNAKTYCENLEEGGFSDWRLPTISELRTLIRNCDATITDGSCGVTDSCNSWKNCQNSSCFGCASDNSGKYSLLGDVSWLWSSSPVADYSDGSWGVGFYGGHVSDNDAGNVSDLRCVRKPL